MSKKKLSKLLALYLPYVVIGLLATNLGEAWRLAVGKELGDKIVSLMDTLPAAFANPLPSLHPFDLFIGLCCGAGMRLAVYLKGKNAKKYRHGMEYGSARWGTAKDIEPFMAPKFEDNIILTKTERLMMSNRPPDPKNARNKNVLVVGGSGSGKTRFWLKPNLLQCHSSYVITDPKGSIVVECGNALLQKGYKLKIFNTINFSKSMRYNPMAYIHSEKDILKLVTALMTNTKGEGQGGDPFWDKAERLLLVSLIAYLHYEAPVEEQNFATLLEMLNTMQVSEDDETYQNPVDLLFEDLGKKKPKSFAVRQYKLYKLAAGKTAKSILISCGARLAPFDIQEVRDATMYDELELDKLGDRKTALFLIMSDTDSTFNFLISMIYTQLFNLLCDKADDVYGGKLPIHVRCLIDECANIGQIPQLEKLVATIRSREISACLVLQTRSQLKAIYKDNADTIVGNMDSQIFLGGSESTTLKDLAEALGKETIDSYNNSDTRGNSPSYGTSLLIQSITLGAVTALSGGAAGWRTVAIIYAIIGLIVNTLSVFSVKELPESELVDTNDKKEIEQDEKYNLVQAAKLLAGNKYYMMICGTYILQQIYGAMISMGTYYATYILGNQNLFGVFSWAVNIPLIIALVFTPTLVAKWSGMYKLNVLSYSLATVARALVAVAGYMGSGNVPLMLLFTAVATLGQGPWQGDMNAVIAACSEYTWLTKHKRVDCTMYSCTSLGVKLGGGLGTAITGCWPQAISIVRWLSSPNPASRC